MQTKSVVIRMQTLDGEWEATGVDRLRGVWPENDRYDSDSWGSSACSFDLRRDPGAIFPDLMAFTPIEVEIGGVRVWKGRVKETPTREGDRVCNVQGEGSQFHLDDDVFARVYVHNRLSEYVDQRSLPGTILGATALNAAGVVNTEGGIYLGWPNATVLGAGATVGVTLDLGDSPGVRVIAVDWQSSNNAPSSSFFARGNDLPGAAAAAGQFNDAFSFALNTGASGSSRGAIATARRYAQLFILNAAGGPLGADVFVRVTGVRVFTDAAFESAGASVLTTPVIVGDALDRGTILLSSDRSQVDPDGVATFTVDSFVTNDQQTPREVIEAANAMQGFQTKVDVQDRMVFRPKPSSPLIEIGAWPGSVFDDASANSSADIFNGVKVQGSGADGQKLTVQRGAAQQPGVLLDALTSPAPDNSSFATNTASWTASASTTITRDTVVFDTAPASGRWDRAGSGLVPGDTLVESFTGTFAAGVTYVLNLRLRVAAGTAGLIDLTFGDLSSSDVAALLTFPGTSFATYTMSWTPRTTTTNVDLGVRCSKSGVSTKLYVDSLELAAAQPTLVDRRGFKRTHILPIANSLTPELGARIGDLWLADHKTTPLKGTVQITGDRATRTIKTGASIPPEQLLLMTGDLLGLAHRVDPDTGAQRRDGRIATVSYAPAADTATVAIDSTRTLADTYIARLASVVGTR